MAVEQVEITVVNERRDMRRLVHHAEVPVRNAQPVPDDRIANRKFEHRAHLVESVNERYVLCRRSLERKESIEQACKNEREHIRPQ